MPALVWRSRSGLWREPEKRCRHHLKPTAKTYRVDETCIRIRGGIATSSAADREGQTIDFLLAARRDLQCRQALLPQGPEQARESHPRVINVDKSGYPPRSKRSKRKAPCDDAVVCANVST